MSEFLISICIATYNRANFISETLDSIVKQLNYQIEIIIVDGASTDNTEEIVKKYLIHSNFKYFKLNKKGGVDYDYNIAVGLASGRYCWLFTDDDIIKPNSISKIITEIENNKFSLIIINSEIRNKDLTKILERYILPNTTYNNIYNRENFNIFFKNTISYLSFIGCVIIEKELWNSREKEKYFNTEFIHVGVIFQKVIQKQILVISEPMIIIRIGNEQWTSRSFEIWLFKWPRLINSFNIIPYKYKSIFSEKPSFRRLRNVFVQRCKGSYNFSIYKKWFHNEKHPNYWKLSLFLISIIPVSFSKLILNIYLIKLYEK